MSAIVLDVAKEDGSVEQERVGDATQLNVRFSCFSFRRRLTRRPFAAAGSSTTRRRVRQHRASDARGIAQRAPLSFVSVSLF
jgi:hypothetical protein